MASNTPDLLEKTKQQISVVVGIAVPILFIAALISSILGVV